MNERNQKKETMKARITGMMIKDPDRYTKDNIHQVVVDIVQEDYGIIVTSEMITKISSADRTRQNIQQHNKDLNNKTKKIDDMEKNDRDYYSGKNKEGKLF